MIILGIDPGSRITGYGLIRKEKSVISHIDNGLVDCQKEKTFHQRLTRLFKAIQSLIQEFKPQVLAIENIFYAKNIQSTLKLGQARGACIVGAALLEIPIFEYSPLEVKQSVCGYGVAPKEQVQKMVRTLLKLPEIAEENASDALAIALCHAHSEKLNKIQAQIVKGC